MADRHRHALFIPDLAFGQWQAARCRLANLTHRSQMPRVNAVRSSTYRLVQLLCGGMMILTAPLLTPVPGPAGVFVFAGGMVLVLRNSPRARRRWGRLKRRWPRGGHFVDRMMRRRSALRRHARDRAAAVSQRGDSAKTERVN